MGLATRFAAKSIILAAARNPLGCQSPVSKHPYPKSTVFGSDFLRVAVGLLLSHWPQLVLQEFRGVPVGL